MNAGPEISFRTLQRFTLNPEVDYSIDDAAHLARVPRHLILVCCKHGLISPHIDPVDGRYLFDEAGIRTLQRIGYLHTDCGVNLTGIRIILGLMDEMERLKAEQAESIYD